MLLASSSADGERPEATKEGKARQARSAFWNRLGSTAFSVSQLLEPESWVSELQALDPPAPPLPPEAKVQGTGAVAVIDGPVPEALVATCVAARQPVLLRGWARDAGWGEALRRWGLSFFESPRVPPLRVSVDSGAGVRRRELLSDYVARLREGRDDGAYLRLWHYEEDWPELGGDFAVPRCFADGFMRLPEHTRPPQLPRWVFIGPQGAYTPLHTDPYGTHAWFLQLHGRKRFELFRPEHVRQLSDGTSFADLRSQEDLERRFPEASAVPRLTAELGPGDLLFLPANWPHTVLTLEGPSVSLTHNFLDDAGVRFVRTAFLLFTTRRLCIAAGTAGVATCGEEEEEEARRKEEAVEREGQRDAAAGGKLREEQE